MPKHPTPKKEKKIINDSVAKGKRLASHAASKKTKTKRGEK